MKSIKSKYLYHKDYSHGRYLTVAEMRQLIEGLHDETKIVVALDDSACYYEGDTPELVWFIE